MASVAASAKHEWIIILPDHEGVLEQRMRVRQDHFKKLEPRREQGFWKLGGKEACFCSKYFVSADETVPKEGESLKIKGSVMLALAESEEEVLVALQDDPYYRSNIWDWEKPSQWAMVSLYANLLDPSSSSTSSPAKASNTPGTISRAPVVFKNPEEVSQQDEVSAQKQQISAAALRFQPTKRPQQRPKPKPPHSKPTPPLTGASPSNLNLAPTPSSQRTAAKSTLADWTAPADDEDVNGFYGGGKRQRGGRKKRKKTREELHVPQNWDDIYDPSRPNNYEEYKNSDEKLREVRDWKDRLYAHRMKRTQSSEPDSDEGERPRIQESGLYAHPSDYSFAPPPSMGDNERAKPVAPPPPAHIPNGPTGEDAYARRMHLSQIQQGSSSDGLPPTPVSFPETNQSLQNPVGAPTPPDSAPTSISRAPVRYNLPSAPTDLPASEAELQNTIRQEESDDELVEDEAPRSLRPGQKGFAERLMSKYGWTKGSGLGASESGIVNPLRVQVEKQKKKPDSEGGGFVGPGGRGKIIGGKRKAVGAGAQEGKFGPMSEVVLLRGMVDGMDLDQELKGEGDGGLMQEIGEECGDKYGRVERVFIHRSTTGPAQVYVKFTSQLSALRAVNALEGRIFNGNAISAKFYDSDDFEAGVYQ
ncbi:MAG: hypothetical protein M1835_002740 [Candelina submexicana]|nr:MAG: hypothetical protein M1835_002740 [Candelina submexicana]